MEYFNEADADDMVNGRKTYYSISEVCTQTGLEPHVLRYWESEFSQLRPKKNRAGNRAYREKDIEVVKYIKRLLYDELYTIPGAKRRLAEGNGAVDASVKHGAVAPEVEQVKLEFAHAAQPNGKFREVKAELEGILELLTK